jgi:tRNA(Ile)-lysidine synthase TilS/MesJ
MKYVYEFTNQRKLTKAEFLKWFQKKVLYTIRKFEMISSEDVIVYENKGDFRGLVLEDVLKMFAEKADVEIMKIPSSITPTTRPKKLLTRKSKLTKTAVAHTLDIESDKLVHEVIKGNANNLKKLAPVEGNIIKPLYLFLDKEVLLYAKLKKLRYKKVVEKKDKISSFIDELETKHPEIKNAIVKSYLDLS